MKLTRLQRLAPDPLARLRRLRGDDAPAESDVREAFRNLFRAKDGQVFLNWMIAQTYGRTLPEDADESALRAAEVRKRFLDQILALAEEPGAPDVQKPSRRKRHPA